MEAAHQDPTRDLGSGIAADALDPRRRSTTTRAGWRCECSRTR